MTKKEVGEDVAKKLGIDKVYTELLPDGKVKKSRRAYQTKERNTCICWRWNK